MLGKDYRRPREIDERDIAPDFRPKRAQDAVEDLIRDIKEAPEAYIPYQYDRSHQNVPDDERRFVIEPPGPPNPIDHIAEMIRELTYGEMVELAGEIWACRGDGIEEQGLPETLHRWAKTKQ